MERHIRIPKPAYTSEFVLIVADSLSAGSRNDIPQRYINVTGSKADGRRACDHQRLSDVMSGSKPELLKKLALHCFSGIFLWFDMASGREPELRVFVIHK
jgi:hypothetical protein